jgi:5-methylthioadenosine/S-adenosylhomocysteine deaminase
VDGRIIAVDRLDALRAGYPLVAVKRIENSVLMPGLVNAHAHSGFLRGTAEHLPVWDWLTLHINPMHRVLQPHEAEAASRLCYAESVLGGTTTVVDMWRYMNGSARAAEAIGNRLVAVPYVGERSHDRNMASQGRRSRQRLGWARAFVLCRRRRAAPRHRAGQEA